jgi:class 3 adenylate cyclase
MADLVSYTAFCEASDLLAIRDIVREIHQTTISSIKNWRGAVVNIMGDGIMAVFPSEGPESPVWSAVSAGCIILDRIRRQKSINGIRPTMHAGVDWGMVWIGTITSAPTPGSLTVLGPPINRAARYQGLAKANEIVLPWSKAVQEMLEEGHPFIPGMRYRRTRRNVKGIGRTDVVSVRLNEDHMSA